MSHVGEDIVKSMCMKIDKEETNAVCDSYVTANQTKARLKDRLVSDYGATAVHSDI